MCEDKKNNFYSVVEHFCRKILDSYLESYIFQLIQAIRNLLKKLTINNTIAVLVNYKKRLWYLKHTKAFIVNFYNQSKKSVIVKNLNTNTKSKKTHLLQQVYLILTLLKIIVIEDRMTIEAQCFLLEKSITTFTLFNFSTCTIFSLDKIIAINVLIFFFYVFKKKLISFFLFVP